MLQMPLPEIARIVRQVRLPIQPLPLLRHLAHPTDLCPIHPSDLEIPALLPQLPRHSLNIHREIIPQKSADLCILMVPHERSRLPRIGRVDVDVCSGVSVGAPPGL